MNELAYPHILGILFIWLVLYNGLSWLPEQVRRWNSARNREEVT